MLRFYRFSARHAAVAALLLAAAVGPAAAQAPAAGAIAGESIPVRYVADRYFVAPVLESGDTLVLYTDTGGGSNMIWTGTADRLALTGDWLRVGQDSARLVTLPSMRPGAAIPLPRAPEPRGSRFLVMPSPPWLEQSDGFLASTWFADRVWLFDYPAQTLAQVTGPMSLAPEHRVPLHFQVDSTGARTSHFPRITVVVDGDSLELLFDTGATVQLAPAALEALADGGPTLRGTSFITRSVYERWRERHPDWRVIEGGDAMANAPMIEVPRVTIAGHDVGPVWFTGRSDNNFHKFMAQWMDRPLDGALGGSAFRYFRILVNYPEAYAEFAVP